MGDHTTGEASELEASAKAMVDRLSGPERLLGLGAVLAVANYVLFEVVLEEYFFSTTLLLIASAVLFAMWIRQNRSDAEWSIPYPRLLWAGGYAVGLLGAVEFLTDVRRGVLDSGADIIGGLSLYAACVLMVLGARSIRG